jgi:hypothetical protein
MERIPGDSRHLVLSTIAEAWEFKERSDWTKQTHTDEENAGFMLADIALANEIRSVDQAQATMVGLPGTIAKKDENVFRVISQIKATSSPGHSDALQRRELAEHGSARPGYSRQRGRISGVPKATELSRHVHHPETAGGVPVESVRTLQDRPP